MEIIIILIVFAILLICIFTHSAVGSLRSEIRDLRKQLEKREENTPYAGSTNSDVHDFTMQTDTDTEDSVSDPQFVSSPVPPPYIAPDLFVETERQESPEIKEELPEPVVEKSAPADHRKFNIEKLVGENVFSKIGILALVIGIGFFVKFAIDNDWINETARTVLGLVVGLGLWGIAYYLRDRYRHFSSVLAGGGFAVCFVTIAVAYNYYHLFSGIVTLGIFLVLSAAMTFIALRFDRRELAMMAILGGYVAPFLASGENGSMTVLFSYTALLSFAVMYITFKRNWWELSIAGTIITWIVVALACGRLSGPDSGSLTILCFSTLFFTLFSLPLATVMSRGREKTFLFALLIFLSVANPLAYIAVALRSVVGIPLLADLKGLIPLYIALVNAAIFYFFYRRGNDRFMQTVLLWIVVVFAALFSPVQFTSLSVLALSFSIYALILAAVFATVGRRIFAIASTMTVLAGMAYLVSMVFTGVSGSTGLSVTLLFNGLCYLVLSGLIDRKWDMFDAIGRATRYNLYGIVVNLGCALISYSSEDLIRRACGEALSMPMLCVVIVSLILLVSLFGRTGRYTSVFMPVFGLLMFMFFSFEGDYGSVTGHICHWLSALILAASVVVFARRVLISDATKPKVAYTVFYSVICSGLFIICILSALRNAGLSNYYSAGFSVGIIASGAVLMIIGMRCRLKALRVVSLVFFGILMIKLVSYDLWQLPMLGRIIVFILLGGVLLSLSFLYQRLRATLFADDSPKDNSNSNDVTV